MRRDHAADTSGIVRDWDVSPVVWWEAYHRDHKRCRELSGVEGGRCPQLWGGPKTLH
jgi:hypothetical protein